MKNKLHKNLYLLLILAPLLAAAPILLAANPMLNHNPPLSFKPDVPNNVTLTIVGDRDALEKAVIYYRETGSPNYLDTTIYKSEISANDIRFNLPQLSSTSAGYEYYFSVTTSSGIITLPENNPAINPYRVRVDAETTAISRRFILLNTETTVAVNQDLIFAASIYPIEDYVQPHSVKLLLNGADITSNATISSPLIVYKRQKPAPGVYRFQIQALLKNGQAVLSPVWSFQVSQKPSVLSDLPLNMRGNIILTSNVRSFSQEDSTLYSGSEINDASLRFNLFTREKWFSFATRLYLSSYESSSKQPVNRYSFRLSVPYLDLHLLDYTPNYGSFLISNQNVRGISGSLYTSNLTLSSTYGQSFRAIDGKEIIDTPSINTTYTGGTFKRDVIAAKIDLGEVDGLRAGFGVSKVKDVIDSLDEIYYLRLENDPEPDSLASVTYLTTPKDNVVVGADMRLALNNQRFVLGAEVAASVYNSNIIDGPMTKDDLEEYLEGEQIPFDPEKFEKLIIINKNIEPFLFGRGNSAFQVYLRWFLLNNLISLSYSEIGASFRSLSTSYLQNDAKIITISDYISLFNNRLSIDGGINIVSDNLSEQKSTTTTNTSWYVQALVRPPGNIPYFRTGVNFIDTENDADTSDPQAVADGAVFELKQEMRAYNFGIGYEFDQIPNSITSVDLSYNLSADKDIKENPTFDVTRNAFNISVINTLKPIPLRTRLRFSTSSTKDKTIEYPSTNGIAVIDTTLIKRTYNAFGVRNEYSFLNGMLIPYLDLSWNSYGDLSLSRYDLGTQFIPYPLTTVSTRVELNNYKDTALDERDYSSFGWYLNIEKRF